MLVTIFAAGFISGAACIAGFSWKHRPPPGMPKGAQIIERVRADLRSEVHITPEQEQQLTPLLEKHGAELDAIRADTLTKVLASIEAKNAAVEKLLTTEQRTQFEAHEKKRLEGFTHEVRRSQAPQ
jgi:Spy/CpxP family protein refolding chaperone